MANKIKVKRGAENDRAGATITDYEIHYSTQNGGTGRPERFWVADSNATAKDGGGDLLVGPFEFVSSDGKISVSADYQTGRVSFGLIADKTYNPTRTFKLNLGGYTTAFRDTTDGNQNIQTASLPYNGNLVAEAGESFGGNYGSVDRNHQITVKNDSGENPVLIDHAYVNVEGTTTTFSQTELQAADGTVWQDTVNTASQNFNTIVATPGTFGATVSGSGTVQSITGDSVTDTLVAVPDINEVGFSNSTLSRSFKWGWRVTWFASQNPNYGYNAGSGQFVYPTASEITSAVNATGGEAVAYRPWDLNGGSGVKVTVNLPAGSGWYFYLVTTTAPPNFQPGESGEDPYGWIPYAYSTGNLQQTLTEVTDRLNVLGHGNSIWSTSSNGGHFGSFGQTSFTKHYRIWRMDVPGGWSGDQSFTFLIRDKD